jgi:hypothetical protein
MRLIIGGRRLHRDEGQMEVVGISGQVRAAGTVRHASHESRLHADRGDHPLQVLALPSVDVDPEQLAIADLDGPVVGQLQLAVSAVGVVEADVQATGPRARPTAGMRVQWRIASRTTTARARPAVAYWKTSIARSERRPTKGSTTLSWETRESGR